MTLETIIAVTGIVSIVGTIVFKTIQLIIKNI